MSTKTTAPTSDPVASPVPAPAPTVSAAPQTLTAWKAFAAAKLVPVRVDCQAYPIQGQNFSDPSCHTKIRPSVEVLRAHMANEHGGSFQLYLKVSEGKPSPLWDELSASGLEALDIRCEICDKNLRFHASSFAGCLRRHKGKNRSSYTEMQNRCESATAQFNVTLGSTAPASTDDNDEYPEV